MKRTTTIEWTTITKDESSWPPAYSNFIIARGKDYVGMAYRSNDAGFILFGSSDVPSFYAYIGRYWAPIPLAPLEFNEIP